MPDPVRVFISHHHSIEEDIFSANLARDLKEAGATVLVDDEGIASDIFIGQMRAGFSGRQWLVPAPMRPWSYSNQPLWLLTSRAYKLIVAPVTPPHAVATPRKSMMKRSHSRALSTQYPAPLCLKTADQQIRAGLKDFIAGSALQVQGINNVDISQLDAGTALITKGTTAINQATTDISNAVC